MSLRLISYPFGSVRARALAAGLLSEPEFTDLINSTSQAQAERFLANLPGSSGAAGESSLPACFMAFGSKLARALPATGSRLIGAYLSRNQVENLKLMCRSILTGRREFVKDALLPEGPEKFVTEQVIAARSLRELAARLPPGPFRTLLRTEMPAAPEERSFYLDSALERIFWARLVERLVELPFFDRLAARELLGMRADIDRFRIVGRGMHAGLPAESILAALPPLGTLLLSRQVRKALTAADPAAACRQLLSAVTGEPFNEKAGEVFLWRRLYHHLQKTLRSAPFDISVPLRVLLLKELEIRDLRAVLSGQRLGAERHELTSLLSCIRG